MYQLFFKRLIDFTLSLIGFIVISPIFIMVWVWLTIANKGAGALFFQERPGKDEVVLHLVCL
jgi:undecaprenyl phosphate N,N'-diacetylbacillosamine 1-phosphate transferase